MWNILSKVFIVVIIILAFPTGLILASQNSSPGDNTYSIKRGMEGILSRILSLHPVTKAYFRTDLSNRRFKESVVLLKRTGSDKATTNISLVEMLNTTAVASAEINDVTDPALKKRLADDLSSKITNYRQGLLDIAKEKNQIPPVITTTPAPSLTPSLTPIPTVAPTTIPGQPTPTPTRIQVSPTPSPSPTPTPITTCSETIRNYSQCGGASGYEQYPRTHLIMIAEYKNSCTNAIRNVVTDDWDLKIQCDPDIIGQCSADNIPACIEMLDRLQKKVSNIKGSQQPQSQQNIPSALPTPIPLPTLTFTPTPTHFKSAYETLRQQAVEESSTPSATESGEQTSTSGGGLVQGLATSIKEINLKNLINSLISIFK